MWPEIIILSVIVLVLGPIGTLMWWKLADQWVSDEHKRFKKKPGEPDRSNTVIVKVDGDEKR